MDLALGAGIELRRASCAGTGPAGQPAELGRQQTGHGEAIEVECRERARDAHTGGRLVPSDRPPLSADPVVQRPADGFVAATRSPRCPRSDRPSSSDRGRFEPGPQALVAGGIADPARPAVGVAPSVGDHGRAGIDRPGVLEADDPGDDPDVLLAA